MSAAVSIYINHHTPSGQSRLYRVTQLRTDGVHCRESVVSKHNHCCTAAVHTVDQFFPATYVCTSVKSLVHTVQYVSKHTGSYYCCTVDPFYGNDNGKRTPCMSAAWKTILKQVC